MSRYKGETLDVNFLQRLKITAQLAIAICFLLCNIAAAAPQDTIGNPTHAQEELEREHERIHEEARKEGMDQINVQKLYVAVSGVSVTGNHRMTEDEVLSLVPELKRTLVRIHRLSQQIQLVNDTGAMRLSTNFTPVGDNYQVTVFVEEKKSDHVFVTVDNTGNTYTGDWRLTTSYLNTNATNHADTIGAAVVTSPGHWDDVKQAAVSYKMLFPKEMGSLVFTASWSDVNLGSIYSEPGILDYTAGGRGVTVGLHGQKYISYTSRNKDFWDFGIDHKSYDNENKLTFLGVPLDFNYNYAVTMLSASFIHNDRSDHHAFTYSLGTATNLGGDKDDYQRATPDSEKNFLLWRAGAAYQYRTNADWLFGLRLRGQYTNQNVVSTEQLSAGGLYTVRGFNERTVSADTGLVGSFEIFTPEWIKNSRFCFFYDFGTLHNNNNNLALQSETLASVGLGYRYNDQKNGISLRVEYAKIVDDIHKDLLGRQGHKNWNVIFTKSF